MEELCTIVTLIMLEHVEIVTCICSHNRMSSTIYLYCVYSAQKHTVEGSHLNTAIYFIDYMEKLLKNARILNTQLELP